MEPNGTARVQSGGRVVWRRGRAGGGEDNPHVLSTSVSNIGVPMFLIVRSSFARSCSKDFLRVKRLLVNLNLRAWQR